MESSVGMVDFSKLKLTDVLDVEVLQRFQDSFAKGMGLASVTVDADGNPVTKPSSYTRFCMDFTHATKTGDDRCAQSHKRGGQEAARIGKPYVYECHAGLIDFAAPIIIEGHLMGTILGGQIVEHKQPEEKYRKVASEIGVNPDEYVKAAQDIHIIERGRIEEAANVLFIVTNSMSNSAYQKIKLNAVANTLSDSLHQISATMEELAASATTVSQNQAHLNSEIKNVDKVASEINSVMELIKAIAGQTNLLGLNAAIEAARAGTAGLGFSVVAQEIRKLSENSRETVGKIEQFTALIRKSVDGTVSMGSETLSTVEQQAAAIEEVTASVEEISSMAQELTHLADKA